MACALCIQTLALALISLSFLNITIGDPRTSLVAQWCNHTLAANGAILADNFVPAMDNLSSHVNANGYGTSITGVNPNAVCALAQCYGDLSSIDCKLCFSEIRSQLPKCYPDTGGTLFLDGCFGRYENYTFFDEIFSRNDTTICSFSNNNSNPNIFGQTVKEAVGNVSLQAQNKHGFAVGSASNFNSTVYVLAQCWENLNSSLCSSCLHTAASAILSCSPATEGRALYAGCFLRYSTKLFWNVNQASSSSSGTSKTIWIIVGLLVGAIVLILLGLLIAKRRGLWGRKKQASLKDLYGLEMAAAISQSNLNFKYEDLRKATNNFKLSNKLGQGSYGTVYKGVLSDGKEVAVKQLFLNTRQWIEQFFNEVDLVNKVRHKNLVKLLGCSLDGSESLLVYEYYKNRSLDQFIFDESHDKLLDWQQRFDIIQGVAEGLSYLHDESDTRIIHRDIKASNILLDDKLKPKITDFGLARSFAQDQTHLTTGIAGTLGYLAPEYIVHGHLTEKADVYSFGVLVLEIVTGKRCSSPVGSHAEHSLLAKVWNQYKANTLDNVIDNRIYNKNVRDEIIQVILIGLQCTQADSHSRPTMSRVVELLRSNRSGDDEELVLLDPPFLDVSPMEALEGESSRLISADMSVSRLSAR
ncbi:cysteine-rich receptor-like protein kinase 2 [Dendrobium catenatum]|uniref:Cysteine-rich receptor-like protein kinase 2 n=1 Tax=Dendrobium catenatum TaxID=906689 RepID=A0A2I0WWW8_9ASPA|nr:cysteine-rich receptor-like protein kinase 2 [Dendrobium catenatum]XP_020691839.1 cysteine-rich receptor-like protein kinase 2 [Dendrobium catenatum]XP_028550603.1 cysteine-rich receptor-like protein kinase 2 [Dendrobium catenatum]PKU80155.1 Cysteine-rich receptor-like protein kinase 2 [Dendrobium catenatum]